MKDNLTRDTFDLWRISVHNKPPVANSKFLHVLPQPHPNLL